MHSVAKNLTKEELMANENKGDGDFLTEFVRQIIRVLDTKITQQEIKRESLENSLSQSDEKNEDHIKASSKHEEIVESLESDRRFESLLVEIASDTLKYKETERLKEKQEREEMMKEKFKEGFNYLFALKTLFNGDNPNLNKSLYEINDVETESLINFNRVLQAEAVDNCYNPYPNTNRMVDHLYKLVFSKTDKIYSMNKTSRKVPSYAEIKRILDRVLSKINAFNKHNPESTRANTNTHSANNANNFVEIADDEAEESASTSQGNSPALNANDSNFQEKMNNTFDNETFSMSHSDLSTNDSNLINVSNSSNMKRKSIYENKENQVNKAKRSLPISIRPRPTNTFEYQLNENDAEVEVIDDNKSSSDNLNDNTNGSSVLSDSEIICEEGQDVFYKGINLTRLEDNNLLNRNRGEFTRLYFAYSVCKIIFTRNELLVGIFPDEFGKSKSASRINFDPVRIDLLKKVLQSSRFRLNSNKILYDQEWNQLRTCLNYRIGKISNQKKRNQEKYESRIIEENLN